MAPLKVIGAGYGRTGTLSMKVALSMLGYNCLHLLDFATAELHPEKFLDAYLHPEKPVDWDDLYDGFDAAVDWPTISFVERLIHAYPDAKVILTARDVDSWYNSFKNTVHKLSVELGNRYDDLPEHTQRWVRMAHACQLDGAAVDPKRFNDEEAIKAKYNAHVEWVKKNVPSERLFIMELGEGWDRLCKFLNVPVPSVPYPSANSAKDFEKDFMAEDRLQYFFDEARKIDAATAAKSSV
ncbi:hypothetical protein O0I10_002124 [Lichtheimia ornata]|uniref:P-loop containing nucleoside triphosphate hydrolase protein n=1 Tax=Lichtheimia ornata TaxID=688661 RepID=A0AAD7VCE2_9FUNG|nr:uncharacterized protein O0I10_002124 [Lichtheimia ornata]KAJ8662430.1 hypothetical protein O0I10_002124 [Lichtheimia ornata]